MPVSNEEYSPLLQVTPGRAVFATNTMRKLVDEAREPGLIGRIDIALASGREALRINRQWGKQKASGAAQRRGDAAVIDIEFNASWKALESTVSGQIFGAKERPMRVAAEAIRDEVFAQGIGAITQQAYEEQLSRADEALEALRRQPLADHVHRLRLEEHLLVLDDVGNRLRVELEKHAKVISWEDVTAASARARELYLGVIFTVLSFYWDGSPAAVARREELLKEVNRQNAALAEAYRRHRPLLDVDPDTGDVLEEDAVEPAAEPAA